MKKIEKNKEKNNIKFKNLTMPEYVHKNESVHLVLNFLITLNSSLGVVISST